jgi:hypothetical protein
MGDALDAGRSACARTVPARDDQNEAAPTDAEGATLRVQRNVHAREQACFRAKR